jgi:hypothetical protein
MSLRLLPGWILLLIVALQTSGCVTNPYTKRWQLLMIPQSYEANLGAQAYQDVLSDPKVKMSHHRGCQKIEIRRIGKGV